MGLGKHRYDIFLDLVCRHGHELGRKDRDRNIVMRLDVGPVFTDHFEYPPSDTVAFDRGLGHFLADHDRDAAVDTVLVFAVLEQYRAVTDSFAVAIKVSEATMTMEAVFLS